MPDVALAWRLENDKDLADLVSTRIYTPFIPQGDSLPAIRFQRISNVPLTANLRDSGHQELRFQVDCVADTYRAAREVRDNVVRVLNRWREDVPAIRITGAAIISERYLYDESAEQHRYSLDFAINTETYSPFVIAGDFNRQLGTFTRSGTATYIDKR